jgi:hypothetical protein
MSPRNAKQVGVCKRRICVPPGAGSASPPITTWVPSDKAGLQLWLKADAITGLSDTDLVSSWVDSSGNARDAVQATTGNKPTYRTNQVNGLPSVVFTGTNITTTASFLEFGTDNIAASGSPLTVAFVIDGNPGAATWFRTLFTIKTAVANQNFTCFLSNSATFGPLSWAFSTTVGQTGADQPGDFLSTYTAGIIVYDGGTVTDPAAYTSRTNNAAATVTSTTGSFAHNLNANYLGRWGAAASPFSFDGGIAEFIIWNSVMSSEDFTDFADYVSTKYNIAQSLSLWTRLKKMVTRPRRRLS